MLEIKTIGRGGQGAVTFSQLLAIAAFEQGYPVVQAMPSFGVERRGAPSFSFARLSKVACTGYRSLIYEPDIVVVLDPTLVDEIDVTEGLKKNGILIINSNKTPKQLKISPSIKTYTADATSVALKIFKQDIVNTAMLGAFAAITKEIELESLYKALEQRFAGKTKLIDLNKKAIKEVYNKLK
jgi:pyruvate ferredoxin oxidoreductase gamma subunit